MLTAIVLTKNSQDSIATCLKSLKLASAIIVVDDYSHDNTIKIARKFRAQIYSHKVNNNFAVQRNYALKKVTTPWALFVDSDEYLSSPLQREIMAAIKNKSFNGFMLRRRDIFLGRKLFFGETGSHYLLRLARRDSGIWARPVHEIWHARGPIGTLKSDLIHSPAKTTNIFLQKLNYYATINSNYLIRINTPGKITSVITYPLAKFFLNYFIKQGFRDGIRGLLHAVMMSFHSYLTRSKLYLNSQ